MPSLLLRPLALVLTCCISHAAFSRELSVPVTVDYQLIDFAVRHQLFTGPGTTAEVYGDGTGCNGLTLAEPEISGMASGQVRLVSKIRARGGTPLGGGNCMTLFDWQGVVEVHEEPYLSSDGSELGFRIVESELRNADDSRAAPGLVWNWIKAYVQPHLELVRLDLKPVLAATRELMSEAIPGSEQDVDAVLNSVAFERVETTANNMTITLRLNVPDDYRPLPLASDDVLSPEELARWDAAWQSWDAFSTWLLKTLATELGATSPGLHQALADILLEARYDLRRALAEDNRQEDPVRQLFLSTWSRLAPLLKAQQSAVADVDALRYLAFISAGDALKALDGVAGEFGIQLDSATFRSLARLLTPSLEPSALDYNTAVDPALRQMLGLPATFDEAAGGERGFGGPFALLIPMAQAAPVDPSLVKRLTGWVPKIAELDSYLAAMGLLLDSIAATEREQGKIPLRFVPIYENLILATAWQESCWRQFINRGGKVTPLRSSAGSIGLMQVNLHVWRGIYDPAALRDDVAYNARAGNEILVHYLVDYAIKKKEHEITGSDDSVARAAYAIYNGGPRHLARYRNEATSAGLKKIDAEFWKKYRAIQQHGPTVVKACYMPR